MDCTHTGRDLLDRHLLILAEAEATGFPEIADRANEVWALHEIAIDTLNEYLAQVRQ
jgi:hypothetical protein